MDDGELARRAATGDMEAFELLVRRHTDRVWRMAWSMLRDRFAAEEAVQDTFVKAHRSLGTFRGQSAFGTWLLAICRRSCVDRLRSRTAQVIPLEEARALRQETASPELRMDLERALADLPGADREAFVLVDVLGHSREEAAVIAGVPSSTMRSRVARARERLADALRPEAAAGQG
jgi:RNA polymerase sigma-70 factor (ECF subfamily)